MLWAKEPMFPTIQLKVKLFFFYKKVLIKNDKSFKEFVMINKQNFAQRKEKKHMVNLEHKTFSLDNFFVKGYNFIVASHGD